MIDDPLGSAMKNGPHFQVTLEFAEGFFDFEKVLVVPLHTGGIDLLLG